MPGSQNDLLPWGTPQKNKRMHQGDALLNTLFPTLVPYKMYLHHFQLIEIKTAGRSKTHSIWLSRQNCHINVSIIYYNELLTIYPFVNYIAQLL